MSSKPSASSHAGQSGSPSYGLGSPPPAAERDPGMEPGEDEEDMAIGGVGGLEGEAEEEEFDEEELGEGEDMAEEEVYESESISDSGTDSLTWISWFCSLPGHEYFAEVSEDFIEDDFNLTGLNALVPFYKEALEMILDVEPQEDSLKIPDVSIVESSAELLYGLIHQRYILTKQGLQQMVEKYEAGHFGYCPRVFCHSHPVLPCGRSDLPGLDTVKLYCANCIDCYAPPSSRFHGVDGAFFGTTFPHLLFQSYRELAPNIIAPSGSNANSLNLWSTSVKGGESEQTQGSDAQNTLIDGSGQDALSAVNPSNQGDNDQAGPSSSAGPSTIHQIPGSSALDPNLLGTKEPQARLYTPRIYGFRVSEQAKSGPRMRWMRMRPEQWTQLRDGVMPQGGGAVERSGSGALNLSVLAGIEKSAAEAAAGGPTVKADPTAATGTVGVSGAQLTNLGRPIAGRGG